jgi:hypothetical protein
LQRSTEATRVSIYQQGAGGCGGGFNVAAIDPSTGELLSFPGSLLRYTSDA